MSRQNTLGKTATTITIDGPLTRIRYHNTDVVTFSSKNVLLNTGGWYTATTKLRMNQAAWQFGLNYGVSQRKGKWYVSRWNPETRRWYNEMPFNATGTHVLTRKG